ncbi:hypothetical protein ACFFGH_28295 [Lysobacter korlensis]|uniref:Uncharacterized protein n=1 Tax=Lysobacter korlensis TaxID=553636 RepID=A0ABV6RXP0_9GAMM
MQTRTATRASAEPRTSNRTRWVLVGALAVGAVLGFAGNFLPRGGDLQSVFYAVSAAGLILGSVLLALRRAAAGDPLVAAGFGLLALGETRVMNPVAAPGSEESFAVGVLLYAPGLLLIAASAWAPVWVRVVGALAALPFGGHALMYLSGAEVSSAGPVASVGYGLLTLTVAGWIVTVLRSPKSLSEPAGLGAP